METSFVAGLANSRLVFGLVTVVGMAMCSAGIGKAARLGLWSHPLTIAGYGLGVAALVLAAQGVFRFRLLPVSNTAALLGILGIIVVKTALATLYRS
jgi:hypothetical protein